MFGKCPSVEDCRVLHNEVQNYGDILMGKSNFKYWTYYSAIREIMQFEASVHPSICHLSVHLLASDFILVLAGLMF